MSNLLSLSERLLVRTAARAKKHQGESKRQSGSNLWKYTCPETGKDFYLAEKKTSIKSPYTGKNFTAKPEKDTLSDVGKELKSDQAAAKAEKNTKKAALLALLNDVE